MKEKQDNSEKVLVYIASLPDFVISDPFEGNYNHMGATITDAILQAGLKYDAVVKPRVNKIRQCSNAKTTTGFFELSQKDGLNNLLNWQDKEKLNRILGITKFFMENKIEKEDDLKNWLQKESNVGILKSLRGVGDKTVDYFKILVGIPTTAVDRHIINFLKNAGIDASNYEEAKGIINSAADRLNVNRSIFDYSIWKYMSKRSINKICESTNTIKI